MFNHEMKKEKQEVTRKRWGYEETIYLFKILSKGLIYTDAEELLNDKFKKHRTSEAIKTRVSKIRNDKEEYNKLKLIDDEWFESKNMKYVDMVLGIKTETQFPNESEDKYTTLKNRAEKQAKQIQNLKKQNLLLTIEKENLIILLNELELEEKLKEELSPELYEVVIKKLKKNEGDKVC